MSIALATWIAAASGAVAPAHATEAGDPPRKLAEITLTDDTLPEGCAFIDGAHAISIQASTLYSQDIAGMVTKAKPVARISQSMRCPKGKGTVFYYEYATDADADLVFGFIRSLVWGEDHPTTMHPELIDRWKNIIVVTSFRQPGPIAERVLAKVAGGSAKGQPASNVPRGAKKDLEKAKAAYLKKDYREAEKRFRALVDSIPDLRFAHLYLGHSLFYQERYREAIPEYEKALALAGESEKVELLDERILNDQLGMAYGLSGRLEDARALFQGAIRKDPVYPLYYYNLACAEAEMGNLDEVLKNLKLASERRANFLPGESYPNPRQDDSFKKYLGDPRFEAALKELGFQ